MLKMAGLALTGFAQVGMVRFFSCFDLHHNLEVWASSIYHPPAPSHHRPKFNQKPHGCRIY